VAWFTLATSPNYESTAVQYRHDVFASMCEGIQGYATWSWFNGFKSGVEASMAGLIDVVADVTQHRNFKDVSGSTRRTTIGEEDRIGRVALYGVVVDDGVSIEVLQGQQLSEPFSANGAPSLVHITLPCICQRVWRHRGTHVVVLLTNSCEWSLRVAVRLNSAATSEFANRRLQALYVDESVTADAQGRFVVDFTPLGVRVFQMPIAKPPATTTTTTTTTTKVVTTNASTLDGTTMSTNSSLYSPVTSATTQHSPSISSTTTPPTTSTIVSMSTTLTALNSIAVCMLLNLAIQ
jgi:hypothetical protein